MAAAAAAEHDLDLEQLSRPSVLSSVGRAEIGRDLSCDPLSSRSLSLPLFPPLPGPVGRSVGFIGKLSFLVAVVVVALSDIDQISVSCSVDLGEGGNRLLRPSWALRNRHIRPELQIGT